MLDEAIAALRRFSLVEVGEGSLSVHRLVQEITRQTAEPSAAALALSFVRARFPGNATEPNAWPTCAELLPHSLHVAKHVTGDEHAGGVTWLLDRSGTYVQYRGDAKGASEAFKAALETRRRVLGPEHHDTLASMGNLAGTLRAQGDLPAARKLQESALDTTRRVLGEEHPDTLASMNNLAGTLNAQGDLPAARELQEAALEASTRVLGPNHPTTLAIKANLDGMR